MGQMTLSKERIDYIESKAAIHRQSYFPPGTGTFCKYQNFISLQSNHANLPEDWKERHMVNKDLFNEIVDIFKSKGWSVTKDPKYKGEYKSLSKYHRLASLGELRVTLEIYPAGGVVKFYPTYNPDHPAGPDFGSAFVERMTYLDRKRFELIVKKIEALFLSKGFLDRSETDFTNPREEAEYRMRSCWHFKEYDTNSGRDPSLETYGAYNGQDKDKKDIKNGDLKHFYDYDGRLLCGHTYYNLNNMWWVVSGGQVRNIANFDLFDVDPAKHPRKRGGRAFVRKVERHLQAMSKAHKYEKAIHLRNQLLEMGVKLEGEAA